MQCPNCHEIQRDQARFCANCGSALPQVKPPEDQQPPQPQPPLAPPKPPNQAQPPRPQPYPPQPQPLQPYPPHPRPAQNSTTILWGRPLHFWLFVASAIALVALVMPWYSQHSYGRVSWQQTGFEYSDGTRNTWMLPYATTSRYGGGNGVSLFTLLLAGGIGGLAYKFRTGAWPRWAAYTLATLVGLVALIGVINLLSDANLGPLLFAVAGGLAAPAALQILREAMAAPPSR